MRTFRGPRNRGSNRRSGAPRPPCRRIPRLDERLDCHVVTPPAQRPDAVRQAEVEGDMAIDAVRPVAVQPAQQRRRIENRHRGPGPRATSMTAAGNTRRGTPAGGRPARSGTEHRAVHHCIGRRPPAAPPPNPPGEERREKAAKVLFFSIIFTRLAAKYDFPADPATFPPEKRNNFFTFHAQFPFISYLCKTLWRYPR